MWEAIIAALGALLTGWQSTQSQERANEQNWAIMQQQQQWQQDQAAWTNEQTRKMYNELYSPAAKVSQLKAAGLSPALIYGQGGGGGGATTSAQPGNVGAPVMQPTLQPGMMDSITNILKGINESKATENQTAQTEANIKEIEQGIAESKTKMREMEGTINKLAEETHGQAITNRINEQNLIIQKVEADIAEKTAEDRMAIVGQTLTNLEEECEKLVNETNGIIKDNDKKDEMNQAIIEYYQQQKQSLIAEAGLKKAEEAKAWAEKSLADKKGKVSDKDYEKAEKEIELFSQTIEKAKKELKETQARINFLIAEYKNKKADTEYKKEMAELAKKQKEAYETITNAEIELKKAQTFRAYMPR